MVSSGQGTEAQDRDPKGEKPEMISYRRTKSGQWVAYGPAEQITAGEYVEIEKRGGGIDRRMVESVGKSFRVDGRPMVYGYLGSGATISGSNGGRRMCEECGERRATTTAVDMSGLVGDVCERCASAGGGLSFA